MLLKIAWRNLWRNKRRTLIIAASLIFGVGMLFISDGLSRGFVMEMFNNQIKQHITHIQIHKNGYNKHKDIKKLIPNPEIIDKKLKKFGFVKAYSKRTIAYGMLTSVNSSSGCLLIGIDPKNEKMLTNISEYIVEGKYFAGNKFDIVIGQKLAEKLDVKLGDKIVATASDVNSEVSNELFRVVGIYKSVSNEFDRTYAFISLKTAQSMLSLGNNYHEVAILTNDDKKIDDYKAEIDKAFDNRYEVLSFKDLMPMIMMYLQMYDEMIYVFYMIIGLAVLFGVINTMLMSVFERIQEFGVLMSIGMSRWKIFNMVVLEALVLGIMGTFLGIIFGYLIYIPLAYYGLDLSNFSEGLSTFGISYIVKPVINTDVIVNNIVTMPFITILGALYPAWKAIKLQPTDAMRYI